MTGNRPWDLGPSPRPADRKNNAQFRHDKRDTKQQGREQARDIKH
jgi:hypothetical protein